MQEEKTKIVGFINSGNTCFMNTALQILINLPDLINFFISDDYKQYINIENKLGFKGKVANLFAQLLAEISKTTCKYLKISDFKSNFSEITKLFSDFEEQDTYEFMICLIDSLHEDLKNEENSIISQLFQGMLKSTLTCLNCKTNTCKFEKYNSLSLPLLTPQSKIFYLFLENSVEPLEFFPEDIFTVKEILFMIKNEYQIRSQLICLKVINGKMESADENEKVCSIKHLFCIFEYKNNDEVEEIDVQQDKNCEENYETKIPEENDETKIPEEDYQNKILEENYQNKILEENDKTKILEENYQNKILDENDETKILEENDEAKIPEENDEAKIPEENDEAKIPEENFQNKILDENGEIKILEENDEIKIPEKNYQNKIPEENDEIKIPEENYQNKILEENFQNKILETQALTDDLNLGFLTKETLKSEVLEKKGHLNEEVLNLNISKPTKINDFDLEKQPLNNENEIPDFFKVLLKKLENNSHVWVRIITVDYIFIKTFHKFIYLIKTDKLYFSIQKILDSIFGFKIDFRAEISFKGSFPTLTILPLKNLYFKPAEPKERNINFFIDLFCKKEYLINNEQYDCTVCKKKCDFTKKLCLVSLPKYLIIHFKRLVYGAKNTSKVIIDDVLFINNVKYEISSMGCHYELDKDSGHYLAYVKKDCWYVVNDARVDIVEEIDRDSAYVVVYVRSE